MSYRCGLVTTWKVHSTLVELICSSAFLGFAAAVGFQGPQNAVQCVLSDSDVPMGVAIILFARSLGLAVFITAAQTILASRLANKLHEISPDLTAQMIGEIGLTSVLTGINVQFRASALAH